MDYVKIVENFQTTKLEIRKIFKTKLVNNNSFKIQILMPKINLTFNKEIKPVVIKATTDMKA